MRDKFVILMEQHAARIDIETILYLIVSTFNVTWLPTWLCFSPKITVIWLNCSFFAKNNTHSIRLRKYSAPLNQRQHPALQRKISGKPGALFLVSRLGDSRHFKCSCRNFTLAWPSLCVDKLYSLFQRCQNLNWRMWRS